MPLLTNIERRALEKEAKETRQQDILDLLENRFGTLPNSLMTSLKTIDNLSRLKQLLIDTIKVNSVAEFEQLINESSAN